MQFTQILFALYGGILFFGGFMGWKAGSKISLIMGISSGVLAFLATYLSATNPPAGYVSLAIISGLLSAVFLVRLIKTHKMMPSGMLLMMNVGAFALSICQLLTV